MNTAHINAINHRESAARRAAGPAQPWTIPGTGFYFATREEAELVAADMRDPDHFASEARFRHRAMRFVIVAMMLGFAAIVLALFSGCAVEPQVGDGEAPALMDPYGVASSHLREELLEVNGEIVTHDACELETMRSSPGVYGSSPFDRLTRAQAVFDFFVSPQAFDAFETEYEPEFEALAAEMRDARQRAYDKAEGCAP